MSIDFWQSSFISSYWPFLCWYFSTKRLLPQLVWLAWSAIFSLHHYLKSVIIFI